MKKGIHPQLHLDAVTTCVSCGAVYKVPSTVQKQQVEVCSHCHPVYTGEYRGVIASGRVDRFRKVSEASKKKQEEVKKIEEQRKSKPVVKKESKKKVAGKK
jgi:large subunit ribosomal protein L31